MHKFLRLLDALMASLSPSIPAVERLRRRGRGRLARYRPRAEQLEFRWSSKF